MVQKKVLFVVPRFHTNLLGWIEALQCLGIEVHLVTNRIDIGEDHALVEPRVLQIRHVLPPSFGTSQSRALRGFYGFLQVFSLLDVMRILKEFRAEVVVIRMQYSLYTLVVLMCTALLGIKPVIYSQNACGPAAEEGPLVVIRRFVQRSLGWIEVTPVVASSHFSGGPTDFSPGVFGVPFAVKAPSAHDHAKLRNRLVVVGKFQPRKQHREVILTLARIQSKLPSDFSVEIVGHASTVEQEMYLDEVSSLVDSLGLTKRVALRPNLGHEEALRAMAKAEIFLLFSRAEPASVSQLEAMARSSIPIINSDNGTAAYVEDQASGFVVKNREELELRLLQLMADSQMRAFMGKLALGRHEKHFTIEMATKRWRQVLDQVIA